MIIPAIALINYTTVTYRIAGKFGGLAVDVTTPKLKFAKISNSHIIIRMAILYRTAKFKSANILAIAILGSTAKFNSRQYFQLYGSSHKH